MDMLGQIVEWLQSSSLVEKAVAGAIGIVLATLVLFMWRVARRNMGLFWSTRQRRAALLAHLARYRARLGQDTLRVHHSWMKDEQTLEDILIPVMVQRDGSSTLAEFADVLRGFTRTGDAEADEERPRLMIVRGPPGSGKSVALKVAARQVWLPLDAAGLPNLVPVLLSFADLREGKFDLVAALSRVRRRRSL